MIATHTYRTLDVPVSGGDLRVGVWEPEGASDTIPTVLAIHGVTSSHLAWPFVVDQLPGVRVIAPDLRGRGRSNEIAGPAGMSAHARDMVAVLDAFDLDSVPVIGHSMGGFVSVVLAHQHPERVTRVVLIDGGLPLDVPAGLSPEQLVAAILGPTAERLEKRWPDVGGYVAEFWRDHPAFAGAWTEELERYIAYDLVPEGEVLRPATSLRTTVDDTIDMNTGTALPEALADIRHPMAFVSVPRGLQDEEPGLYAPDHLQDVLAALPSIRHVPIDGLNHYTIVMSPQGAEAIGELLREEVRAGSATSGR